MPEYPPYEQEYGPDVVISTASVKTAGGKGMRATLQQGGGLQAAWLLQVYPIDEVPWTIFLKLPGGIPYDHR